MDLELKSIAFTPTQGKKTHKKVRFSEFLRIVMPFLSCQTYTESRLEPVSNIDKTYLEEHPFVWLKNQTRKNHSYQLEHTRKCSWTGTAKLKNRIQKNKIKSESQQKKKTQIPRIKINDKTTKTQRDSIGNLLSTNTGNRKFLAFLHFHTSPWNRELGFVIWSRNGRNQNPRRCSQWKQPLHLLPILIPVKNRNPENKNGDWKGIGLLFKERWTAVRWVGQVWFDIYLNTAHPGISLFSKKYRRDYCWCPFKRKIW